MVKQRTTRIAWLGLASAVAIVLVGVVGTNDSNASRESRAPALAGPLDGLVFIGETGREGGDKGRSDKFVFRDGKFRASSFSAYGFNDAAYESSGTAGSLSFAAAVVSSRSSAGSMHWTGTLRDGLLEGTMRWDHGWESRAYWFRGRVKDEKAVD